MPRNTAASMQAGVNAVIPGTNTPPGWVSGDIKSIAASAGFNVLFDLGAQWQMWELAIINIMLLGPATSINSVSAWSRDDAVAAIPANDPRRCCPAYGSIIQTLFASVNAGAGPQSIIVRPLGRYLVVTGANADATNATGATSQVGVTLQGMM